MDYLNLRYKLLILFCLSGFSWISLADNHLSEEKPSSNNTKTVKSLSIYDDIQSKKSNPWDVPNKNKITDPQVKRIDNLSSQAKIIAQQSLENNIFISDDIENDIADSTWCLYQNDTLSTGLIKWGAQAGWTVKWDADFDYPIDDTFCLRGSFKKAASMLTDSYSESDRPIYLDLYPTQSVAVFSMK